MEFCLDCEIKSIKNSWVHGVRALAWPRCEHRTPVVLRADESAVGLRIRNSNSGLSHTERANTYSKQILYTFV